VLPVVAAVAVEVVRGRRCPRARSRPAHAHLMPRESVGPLARRAGVLPPPDAEVVCVAVFASGAVVVLPVHARAVVEEAGPALRLHQRVAAVVGRVVEEVVIGRAQRVVEALLVGRGVAEVPARAVAVEADGAAFIKRAARRRARNGLQDPLRAVLVEWADHADVAGAVKARIARAVGDDVAPGRALAVVWRQQRLYRAGYRRWLEPILGWRLLVTRSQARKNSRTRSGKAHKHRRAPAKCAGPRGLCTPTNASYRRVVRQG
jgi:hypothetical protein